LVATTGSGVKYKRCCLDSDDAPHLRRRVRRAQRAPRSYRSLTVRARCPSSRVYLINGILIIGELLRGGDPSAAYGFCKDIPAAVLASRV
jgi:hypothetical protein